MLNSRILAPGKYFTALLVAANTADKAGRFCMILRRFWGLAHAQDCPPGVMEQLAPITEVWFGKTGFFQGQTRR